MTNLEKYRGRILEIIETSRSGIAGIKDGILVPCNVTNCNGCSLNIDGSNCIYEFIKWLYEDDGEEHDGCNGCKYEYKREDESPCTECSMNYMSKWEPRPKKTRQGEFLEHCPNAKMRNKVIEICPKSVDIQFNCEVQNLTCSCSNCRQNYWLQEVEE